MRLFAGLGIVLVAIAIATAWHSIGDASMPLASVAPTNADHPTAIADGATTAAPAPPPVAANANARSLANPPVIGTGEPWTLQVLTVDALGIPVADTRLLFSSPDGGRAEGTTDEDGRWRGSVAGAAVDVRAWHDDVGRSTLAHCEPSASDEPTRASLWLLRPVTVRVTVLDRNLQPAAGQRVTYAVIWRSAARSRFTSTDGRGQCGVEVAAGSECHVSAFGNDDIFAAVNSSVVATDGAEVVLIERGAFAILGRVNDAQGGVANATVRLFAEHGTVVDQPETHDESGAFRLVATSAGRYAVTARDGRSEGHTDWLSLSSAHPVAATTVTLQPLLPTRGRVTNARGQALEEIDIAPTTSGLACSAHFDCTTQSAADGSFVLYLPPGTRWRLATPGWRPAPEFLAGEQGIERVYEPTPPREVVIEVLTEDARPAMRPQATLLPNHGPPHVLATSSRDLQPRRRALGLEDHHLLLADPPHEGRACITDFHFPGQAAWLDLADAALSTSPVRVQLRAAASLVVEVQHGGKPVRGLALEVHAGGATHRERIGANGVVRLPWVSHGEARIEIRRGPECLHSRLVELLPGRCTTESLVFRP